MNSWTFIMEHLADPAVWVGVVVFLVVLVGVSIRKVAELPYFGGEKHWESLEEHYLHGEMTTEEYEDRKNQIVTAH